MGHYVSYMLVKIYVDTVCKSVMDFFGSQLSAILGCCPGSLWVLSVEVASTGEHN